MGVVQLTELQRDSAVPLYAQLEAILRAQIATEEFVPDQRIPSENELNRMYGVSRMTARGVLTTLVNDGLLFRVPGKGTFVAPLKINTVSPAYRGIREQLEGMGYETSTQLLGATVEDVPEWIRERLGLASSEPVYAIRRLRSVQGNPISLHHSYVPARLAPGLENLDVVNEQLCVVLESQFGLRMRKVAENLEAIAAGTQESKQLGIRLGAALLRLEDLIADGDGKPFEFSRIVFRGDKIRLSFTYDF